MQTPSSPERRTDEDLQRILDSLIGEDGFVLSGQLPDILSDYERKNDIIILDPGEHASLRSMCRTHSDLQLGLHDLFQFLTTIPKARPARSVTPSPGPSSPMEEIDSPQYLMLQPVENGGTVRPKARPRRSDRIRSASDTSTSEDEDKSSPRSKERDCTPRKVSATQRPFPGAAYALPVTSPTHDMLPKRVKTLSDSSSRGDNSPFAARVRTAVLPPGAYGAVGGWARPIPANRRRSGGGLGSRDIGSDLSLSPLSPDAPITRQIPRSISMSSDLSSPRSRKSSTHSSPGLDVSAYHDNVRSPASSELDLAEHHTTSFPSSQGMVEPDELDLELADDLLEGNHLSHAHHRLSKLSTESSNSLSSAHDKLRELQKANADLSRKLKESERQLAVLGAENESLVESLQQQLDEAHSEVSIKRKEEKELKGKDRAQLIQISALEADLENLRRSLDSARENHANMHRMYNNQCEEAQRLRDLLRERESEITELEQNAQVHEGDEVKYRSEIRALEQQIKRLEGEIAVVRQAESILEVQRQENLQLKETIDRMKFDLEEARAISHRGTHLNVAATASPGPSTMSRNLGDEIQRRLFAAEAEVDGKEEAVRERVIERVIMRTVRGPASTAPDAPTTIIDEEVIEYADAAVETDPIPEPVLATPPTPPQHNDDFPPPHSPPAYTAEPEPINVKEVLDRAHPRDPSVTFSEGDDDYDALVNTLGMRCEIFEEEIRIRKAEREKRRAAGLPIFGRKRHMRRRSYHGGADGQGEHTYARLTSWATWTAVVFAIGWAVGQNIYMPPGVDPRDYQLFSQMNTIPSFGVAGEGFVPINNRAVLGFVDPLVRLAAGIVPT